MVQIPIRHIIACGSVMGWRGGENLEMGISRSGQPRGSARAGQPMGSGGGEEAYPKSFPEGKDL